MPNEKINNTDEFDLFRVWVLENGDATFFTILYKFKNSKDYVLSNALGNKIIELFDDYEAADEFLQEEGYSQLEESPIIGDVKRKYTLLDKEKQIDWRKQRIIDEYYGQKTKRLDCRVRLSP